MNDTQHRWTVLLLAVGLTWGLASPALAVRIKDVTHLQGMRDNQLIGYGLVVGLDGSGDGSSTEFHVRSLVAFLRRNGVTVDPDLVKVDNVAAVIVTADLPAYARPGQRIDVTVNSIGDAESLQGGTLLMTPLKGPDGNVYAVAQGAVLVGGFSAGSGGAGASKNHVTAGRVPGGALVEASPPTVLAGHEELNLILDNPDFTTAQRVAEVINGEFSEGTAQAIDAAGVSVRVPSQYANDLAAFMAELERLPVHVDQRARIVIDERTGTVVMGEEVRISTLAIAHGNLSIQIARTNEVSQPYPDSFGETTRFSNVDLAVQEEGDQLTLVPEGVSLGEVVQSLNAIGVTPRDLISILQAIKAAGALQAELVVQ
ncbi:MAG TPA: flagellar basal body P-ring protein FlgI [Candidatus Sumerlaeota bacterium]|nr:flagellar basal body P-ring protein FlgI [Candidatus Sumerlaeota bacterium]HOR29648.1 flagellar basal body P-ring protein FlgI [Candidatus Sumerlaeota bacterium]HPK01662.1 flagellar basal body P-ring protein FlgI [Candidatus Sumerlaeota bacterium]